MHQFHLSAVSHLLGSSLSTNLHYASLCLFKMIFTLPGLQDVKVTIFSYLISELLFHFFYGYKSRVEC